MSLELRTPEDLGLAGTYSEVTEFTLPEEATAGIEIPFVVAGHLSGSPAWPNFAVGFFYISGPMDEVTLIMDGKTYTLKKGGGAAKYMEPRPDACTTINLDCKITSLDEGEYVFAALTGYVEEKTFYYDDKVDRTVTVEAEEVGWPWWWIAGIGGGVGLIAVVGVVAYEEKRKEEQLMMMLMRG